MVPFLLKRYFFHFFTLGDLQGHDRANFYPIIVILYITMKQEQKYIDINSTNLKVMIFQTKN